MGVRRSASMGAAPPCLDGRCGAMLRRALRRPASMGAAAQRPYCIGVMRRRWAAAQPLLYRRHAPQRPTVGDLPPDAERPHTGVMRCATQFLFDAQQLVVLRHAIGARRRAGLDLPGIRRHHQVGNRDIFTLA